MSIIYVLIPVAILIVAIAIVVFFWAVKSNQFEDLDRQGYNILFDDDLPPEEKKLAEDRKKILDERD
ncbi:cbb3-type cytochrome oxidase assembly protein CcoS [Alteromonas sp. H39]|uniref:cbb3-type cytochrome oxidase assembly protein CcoS n=1 Tax=Alteromonas sp. H39 TaxID=3389876 RepID=UPI0039E11F82